MSNLLAKIAVGTYLAAAIGTIAWADMAAETAIVGDIEIKAPMLRATPPNAPVAGGFAILRNAGVRDDVLISASIAPDIAGLVQLHQMTMSEGVMSMSEVEGGISVPAGETVTLAPGGLHIMLMQLQQPLSAGETHAVTLTFAEAGEITLEMPVMTLGEIRATFEEAGTLEHGGGHSHGHTGHGS
ncbi:MAG: copper chaperone PCu(A)C [Pseudomonadota bacterium]